MPLTILPFVLLIPEKRWYVKVGLAVFLPETEHQELIGVEVPWPTFATIIDMLGEVLERAGALSPALDETDGPSFICGEIGPIALMYSRKYNLWHLSIGVVEHSIGRTLSTEDVEQWRGQMIAFRERCDRDDWPEPVEPEPILAPEWLREKVAKYQAGAS